MDPKFKKKVLTLRRPTRGRPRLSENKSLEGVTLIPAFVTRDPQGIKLFRRAPKLDRTGVWTGFRFVNFGIMPVDEYRKKFANARVPAKGRMVEMRIPRR